MLAAVPVPRVSRAIIKGEPGRGDDKLRRRRGLLSSDSKAFCCHLWRLTGSLLLLGLLLPTGSVCLWLAGQIAAPVGGCVLMSGTPLWSGKCPECRRMPKECPDLTVLASNENSTDQKVIGSMNRMTQLYGFTSLKLYTFLKWQKRTAQTLKVRSFV